MRTKSVVIGALFGIGASALVAPGTARAFQCVMEVPHVPADGDVDIPTDALLWTYSSLDAHLVGPTGEPVATDERSMNLRTGDGLGVLAPREPLEPNTDYTIEIQYGPNDPIRRVRFRTGAGPTTAAPEPPVFRASEPDAGSGLVGLTRWQTLEFEAVPGFQLFLGDSTPADAPPAWGLADDLSSIEDLVPVPPDDPEAERLGQAVVGGPTVNWVSGRARFSVGITDCGFWPVSGDRQELRFATVDVAGHVSAWTDIGTIELPSQEEAQLAADAEREAEARRNIQGPRACAMPPSLGRARSASAASVLFGLGLAIAARRRAARRYPVAARHLNASTAPSAGAPRGPARATPSAVRALATPPPDPA